MVNANRELSDDDGEGEAPGTGTRDFSKQTQRWLSIMSLLQRIV